MLYDLDIIPLYTMEDIKNVSEKFKNNAKGDLVKSSISKTYEELWMERHEYEKAGIGNGQIIAMIVLTYYKSQLPINIRKWAKYTREVMCGSWHESNVLSIVYEEHIQRKDIKMSYCASFIYPLQQRMLSGKGWLKGNEIDMEVYNYFMNRTINRFPDFVDEEMEEERRKFEERRKLYPLLNSIDNYSSDPRDLEDEVVRYYDTISMEKSIQTDLPYEDIVKIQNNVVQYFTDGVERRKFKEAQMGIIHPPEFLAAVEVHINKLYPDLSNNDKKYILDKVYSAVYGYYILDPLIDNDNITDIRVMDPLNIRVNLGKDRLTSNLTFQGMNDYLRFIDGIAVKNRLNLSEQPYAIFTDKHSSDKFIMRLDITTNVINSISHPYLHIRKIPKNKYTVEDLVRNGSMPRSVAEYLIEKVKTSPGMIFCGKGGSGKSTFMSALLDKIPFDKSGVVVQESEELFSNVHPELMFQHVVTKEQSPTGQAITLEDLTKLALVSDQDYIIIGEIKGAECKYAINAAATGHQFMCSVHSGSSQSAILKMVDYIKYGTDYTQAEAEKMLQDIEVIVFMKKKRIEEISEVTGWDEKTQHLTYRTVYSRDPELYLEKKRKGLIE